ncbi:MAG TPA: ATP-binding cassette domain-containing protein [Thiotrichales bacterium]|nr:ATP-binding cassette domain-containing protein [Thiotrichales bacterium]
MEGREARPLVEVRGLTLAYGQRVIQQDLDFEIPRGEVFVIMGGSGCGKSTLMRHLIGLQRPAAGQIFYEGTDFWAVDETSRLEIRRRIGVMFQQGALWSSMTLRENVTLPLVLYSSLTEPERREMAELALALVGLGGAGERYPSELSGGMRKRAGIARAIVLSPRILFFDEPSAGLDPPSARRLDDLILELRESLGATVVVVTHELASIFAIADDALFLDAERHTMIARGNPHELLRSADPVVREFLTRGAS